MFASAPIPSADRARVPGSREQVRLVTATAGASRRPAALIAVLVVLVSVGLTWAVYGLTLSFPYLFDDLIHMRWLVGHSPLDVWVNIEGLQHYRPLVMSLWVLSAELFGWTSSWPLHLLTLLVHAANGCLAGWLAYQAARAGEQASGIRRLISQPRPLAANRPRGELLPAFAALSAAALFVLFPFSYQAIPSPGSQSKPVGLHLLLAACWLYWQGRTRRRSVLLVGAGLVGALAPFAYESAITVGGYLVLMEYLLWRRGVVERFSPRVFASVGLGLPFLVAWSLVPASYDPLVFPGWEALWQNAVYFAQAVAWPIAAAAKVLMVRLDLAPSLDLRVATWASYPFLALALIYRRRSPALPIAVGWVALSLGVQWVTLSFRYVIDGPRILYPAAVGVALFWADLLSALASARTPWRVGRGLAIAAFVGMVGWGAWFAGDRMALIERGVAVLNAAADRVVTNQEEKLPLFVNLPAWLAPAETAFPLGHEGYLLLPPYYGTTIRHFTLVNRGVDRKVLDLAVPTIRQEWVAPIGYHGEEVSAEVLADRIRHYGDIWYLNYAGDRLVLQRAGERRHDDPPAVATELARFEGGPVLSGLDIMRRHDALVVRLGWVLKTETDAPYTVFVHLYAADGRLVAQDDSAPMAHMLPFSQWKAGDRVDDVHRLTLPANLPEGAYTLGVGLYRSDTGERVPAVDATGRSLAEAMYRQSLGP